MATYFYDFKDPVSKLDISVYPKHVNVDIYIDKVKVGNVKLLPKELHSFIDIFRSDEPVYVRNAIGKGRTRISKLGEPKGSFVISEHCVIMRVEDLENAED